jgi:hypothetical protein
MAHVKHIESDEKAGINPCPGARLSIVFESPAIVAKSILLATLTLTFAGEIAVRVYYFMADSDTGATPFFCYAVALL